MVEQDQLTRREREILEHSLKGGSDRVFRNYFAADMATLDGLTCASLHRQGLMVRRPSADKDGLVYFHVTQAGAEAVGLRLPHG